MIYPKPSYKRQVHKVQKIRLQDRRECWVCGTTECLEEHHALGAANRPLSERYGLKAYFCHRHHNENIPGDPGIHFNPELMLRFKRYAQVKFEEVYSREEFVRIFGRNYL
jgi:hypothetical protein